jgi:hypothetical protein
VTRKGNASVFQEFTARRHIGIEAELDGVVVKFEQDLEYSNRQIYATDGWVQVCRSFLFTFKKGEWLMRKHAVGERGDKGYDELDPRRPHYAQGGIRVSARRILELYTLLCYFWFVSSPPSFLFSNPRSGSTTGLVSGTP